MEPITAEVDSEASPGRSETTVPSAIQPERLATLALTAALFASAAVWLFALRLPLWLDETISYWQISGTFGQIWSRQGLAFPAYSYILWVAKTLFGSSSFALRAPSILAMAVAVVLLYRIARHFFTHDISLVVCIIFCLNPIVVFAAIDARPYAFGVLSVNCAALCLLRWLRTQQTRYAVGLGIACAFIIYFQYLFGVLLPALLLLLVLEKRGDYWKSFWSQVAMASLAFAVFMIPVIPRLEYLVNTRGTHVFAAAPNISELINTFAPGLLSGLLLLGFLLAAAFRKLASPEDQKRGTGVFCVLLGLVPLFFLYVTSVATPLHVFVPRYRLVAIPGIALCWGLLLSHIDSRWTRVAFCLILLVSVARLQYASPYHGYSWRDAIAAANSATAADRAPVLVCSDLPESDYLPLPADPIQSSFFAPFSYYKLHTSIVPLPRTLTPEAKAQVIAFLRHAMPAHQRFLAMGFGASYGTLRWIADVTRGAYTPRSLGIYDGVAVVEYTPIASQP